MERAQHLISRSTLDKLEQRGQEVQPEGMKTLLPVCSSCLFHSEDLGHTEARQRCCPVLTTGQPMALRVDNNTRCLHCGSQQVTSY
ncbi:hypothetical protein Nmel_018391 [Mimus melanotis]